MEIKDNSFPSFPTYQNSNELINYRNHLNTPQKVKKDIKKVNFNDTVVIFNVESYKDHNKKFCYSEEEGLAEFYKEFPYGYNNGKGYGHFDRYFGGVRNPNVTRKNVDAECCCIM